MGFNWIIILDEDAESAARDPIPAVVDPRAFTPSWAIEGSVHTLFI